jgi:hypothetical protein
MPECWVATISWSEPEIEEGVGLTWRRFTHQYEFIRLVPELRRTLEYWTDKARISFELSKIEWKAR